MAYFVNSTYDLDFQLLDVMLNNFFKEIHHKVINTQTREQRFKEKTNSIFV